MPQRIRSSSYHVSVYRSLRSRSNIYRVAAISISRATIAGLDRSQWHAGLAGEMSTKVTSNVLVDQGSAHQLEDFERNGETEPSDACFRAEQFTFSFGNRQGQVSSYGTPVGFRPLRELFFGVFEPSAKSKWPRSEFTIRAHSETRRKRTKQLFAYLAEISNFATLAVFAGTDHRFAVSQSTSYTPL